MHLPGVMNSNLKRAYVQPIGRPQGWSPFKDPERLRVYPHTVEISRFWLHVPRVAQGKVFWQQLSK